MQQEFSCALVNRHGRATTRLERLELKGPQIDVAQHAYAAAARASSPGAWHTSWSGVKPSSVSWRARSAAISSAPVTAIGAYSQILVPWHHTGPQRGGCAIPVFSGCPRPAPATSGCPFGEIHLPVHVGVSGQCRVGTGPRTSERYGGTAGGAVGLDCFGTSDSDAATRKVGVKRSLFESRQPTHTAEALTSGLPLGTPL